MKKKNTLVVLIMMVVISVFFSCDNADDNEETKKGTLNFTANGEGFVKDGFDSEDGWHITFDHVYVVIEGPTAYQVAETTGTRHAGHPHAEIPEGSAHVALTGYYFADLKRSSGDVFTVGSVADAEIGNYNYLNFNIRRVDTASGNTYIPVLNDGDTARASDFEGYSLVLMGTAVYPRTGTPTATVNFTLKFDQELAFSSCGPQEDLDEDGIDDGVLAANGTAKTQMTFHFDHIFGDYEEGVGAFPTDPETMSYWGVGFDYFAAIGGITKNGGNQSLNITQADMKADGGINAERNALYFQLLGTMKTLGHLGEGHCSCSDISE